MDPNQFNLNAFFHFLQNANFSQNTNFQNSQSSNSQHPNPNFQFSNLSQNQNSNLQVPFYPENQNSQIVQQTPNAKRQCSQSASVGGSPDQSSQTPGSQFSNDDGLDAINLGDNDDQFEDDGKNNSHWRWEEDKLLISAWLNVSKDSVVGTDQKEDAFWMRICQYCKENNPGLIKRGMTAIKKRWHRINTGAQGFGGCYDQASRRVGSGSNNDNIMELAHQLYQTNYKIKKCNFVQHWLELRREPKWRSQSTESGSSKRTKVSACGAYSSSSNPEMQTGEESPIRPQGTKAAKRKGKGKSKNYDAFKEEMEAIKSTSDKKISLMEEFNREKARENDMKIILADTSVMSQAQREIHAKLLSQIGSKYQ